MPFTAMPNILVTGTPGSGKSHLSKILADEFTLKHQDVADIVQKHNFLDGYNENLDMPILDEKKLISFLSPIVQTGGNIVEYHSAEYFPARWFQLVLVVRCDTNVIFKRLEHKGYSSRKIQQFVEMEIFQLALDEARSRFNRDIVHEVRCENDEDTEKCVNFVQNFLDKWNLKY
uniref:Adenylate kinase isoenzyme 6 homolog n=1 Tax=Culicoides sonorensis TaxID=179676 RepID=A0A336M8R3_CULSO